MKITLDLDTKQITVPKTFFAAIAKENDIIEKAGGKAIPYRDRLTKALEEALADTDKNLVVKK